MAYSLTAELFSELAIGILIFGVRFYARWRMFGFRNFGLSSVCGEELIDPAILTGETGPDLDDIVEVVDLTSVDEVFSAKIPAARPSTSTY
jgi:hypothetical protein